MNMHIFSRCELIGLACVKELTKPGKKKQKQENARLKEREERQYMDLTMIEVELDSDEEVYDNGDFSLNMVS